MVQPVSGAPNTSGTSGASSKPIAPFYTRPHLGCCRREPVTAQHIVLKSLADGQDMYMEKDFKASKIPPISEPE